MSLPPSAKTKGQQKIRSWIGKTIDGKQWGMSFDTWFNSKKAAQRALKHIKLIVKKGA